MERKELKANLQRVVSYDFWDNAQVAEAKQELDVLYTHVESLDDGYCWYLYDKASELIDEPDLHTV